MGVTKPMWMTKGILVKRMRMAATGAAALAAVAVIGGGGKSAATGGTTPAGSSSTPTPTTAQAAAPNHADMMFAHMMVPHHQQAIEMSDIILAKPGIDPRVVELARQIKAAQGPEIAQLQDWMKQWGMPGMGHGGMGEMPGMGHGGMSGMDGMLSPAEMDALKSAQGVEASKLFLTGMIAHHQGAITMAQNEIKNGQFPDAVSMAKSIVESQQQEIDEMNGILSSL